MGRDGIETVTTYSLGILMIVNGAWVDVIERDALADSWLLGDGHFETLRTYQNRPFALAAHLDRLERAISAAGLMTLDRSLVMDAVAELMKRAPYESGRLRLVVGGDGNWLATHDSYEAPANRLRCTISPWVGAGPSIGKRTSYGERLQIRRTVVASGYDDAILIDPAGRVVEATTCNVILLRNGSWITPTLASGCLPGITRDFLLANFGLSEVEVSRKDLTAAEAVAVTSSLREIQGVESIDGRLLPSSNQVDRLAADFHSWVLGNLAP